MMDINIRFQRDFCADRSITEQPGSSRLDQHMIEGNPVIGSESVYSGIATLNRYVAPVISSPYPVISCRTDIKNARTPDRGASLGCPFNNEVKSGWGRKRLCTTGINSIRALIQGYTGSQFKFTVVVIK